MAVRLDPLLSTWHAERDGDPSCEEFGQGAFRSRDRPSCGVGAAFILVSFSRRVRLTTRTVQRTMDLFFLGGDDLERTKTGKRTVGANPIHFAPHRCGSRSTPGGKDSTSPPQFRRSEPGASYQGDGHLVRIDSPFSRPARPTKKTTDTLSFDT